MFGYSSIFNPLELPSNNFYGNNILIYCWYDGGGELSKGQLGVPGSLQGYSVYMIGRSMLGYENAILFGL